MTMKPPIERIKVSKQGKDILIKIKRHTGLQHWNEICRLAFCHSLANFGPPPKRNKLGESNIEIDWKTFSGNYDKELKAIFYLKANMDGITCNDSCYSEYFREHLERGISVINNIKNIKELL